MMQFFRKLFGTATRTRPASRPRSARLELESLGDRLLLSVTPLQLQPSDITGVASAGQVFNANQPSVSGQTLARSDSGKYAITWEGPGSGGPGIYVRVYDKSGNPLTGPMHIDGTDSRDHAPTIAMNSSGQALAVAWEHQYASGDRDIYVQRFDPNEHAWGGLVPVALTTSDEYEPSIAMDSRANLVVAYTVRTSATDTDVKAWYHRVSGATGTFTVAGGANFSSHHPSLAVNDGGLGVVAYTSDYTATDHDVYAQRIDAQGYTVGNLLSVAATGNNEDDPSVAIGYYGNFVVAFTSAGSHVYARTFDSQGTATSSFLAVGDSYHFGAEEAPSVSMDASGRFVVAYTYHYSSTDRDVRAQVFDSYGHALGASFTVSDSGAYDELTPSVALGDDGELMVAFETLGQKPGWLGPGYSVSAARFQIS
jgi:hypothetical protein